MVRRINRLSARTVASSKRPGMYPDGAGLYLQIAAGGAKSWVYRYMLNGAARYMGLGPLHTVTLAQARTKALEARRLRQEGTDPIEARNIDIGKARLEAAKTITFQDAAERYIESKKAEWRNAKHAKQWTATLKTYAYPIIGNIPVQDVDIGLVMKVLEPIWRTKTETASRVRGRIESILDWARVLGYREGENPARWRGHLENTLPKRSKVQKVIHHPALPYDDIGAFMETLRHQGGVSASALEFLILTATRTSETVGALWSEINLAKKVWTIPGDRIKTGKEHRVSLSAAALAVLDEMKSIRNGDFVFPGGKPQKPLSNMALLALLKRMECSDLTAHGFRSAFRDWSAECTNHPREVAEMALAHSVGDKVEAAYRRGDLFEKRRALMEDWATFCSHIKTSDNVVKLEKVTA